jgi:acyl carrier protein phosphodiesterase
MNFLAHLYLSFNNEEIMIGNFIADHVKGKQITQFSEGIRSGILLHRAIDTFTDTHPVVDASKARLRPAFRKYAPVVADVFYDHFLASEWNKVSDVPLNEFSDQFFNIAFSNILKLPERTQRMLPVMKEHDWLNNYSTVTGISTVMSAMSRRTAFESGMENAGEELLRNYDSYKKEFRDFFPELVEFSRKEMSRLLNNSALSGE